MLATGFISAVTLASQLAKKEWGGEEGDKKRDQILDMAFWVLISAILGSRVLFIIVNWKQYAAAPSTIFSLGGGLVFYGGLLGAMLASYIFARQNGIDFIRLADLSLPVVSLGQCLGRLGCFSAGCCWGDVARAGYKFSVNFPGAREVKNLFGQLADTPSLAYQSMSSDSRYVDVLTGKVSPTFLPGTEKISQWVAEHGHTFGVHPTQLYESIGQFCIFLALISLRRFRRFHGEIMGIWLMAYAVLRSTVELFRGDTERGTLHHLLDYFHLAALTDKVPLEAWYNISVSQFISMCMFTAGATLLYQRGRKLLMNPGTAAAATA